MTIELAGYLAEYDKLPSLSFGEMDYSFMRDEVLDALEITAESQSTDKALKAVAKVKYWERAVAATSGDFDYSTFGDFKNRSQVRKFLSDNLLQAELNAEQFLPDNEADVGGFTMTPDPYIYDEDRENYL